MVNNYTLKFETNKWIKDSGNGLLNITDEGKLRLQEYENKINEERLNKQTEKELKWYEKENAKKMYETYPATKNYARFGHSPFSFIKTSF